ncbi:MAG: diguanylate cyclase [Phormidium sp. BM_Day4_Bin.17]|nr:diguanylate cyclase [Phormidium sp. BM_Day4_Bin.17]UCJ12471.1 MAG: diguanylate cyclase [Phormidium sp. PBR-2020]
MNPSDSTGYGDETPFLSPFCSPEHSDSSSWQTWQHRLDTALLRLRRSLILSELLQQTVDEVHQLLFDDDKDSYVYICSADPEQQFQILAQSGSFPGDAIVQPGLEIIGLDQFWDERIRPPEHFFILDNLLSPTTTAAGCEPESPLGKPLGIPLVVSNRLWGVLMIQQGSCDRPWQSFERDGLELLGSHISQAISHSLQWESRGTAKTDDDPMTGPEAIAQRQRELENTLNAQKIRETVAEQSAILRSFYNSCPLWMGVEEVVDGDINMISYDQASLSVLFEEISPNPELNKLMDLTDIRPSSEIFELWLDRYHQAQVEQRPIQFEYQYSTDTQTYWFLATVSYLGIFCYPYPRFSYVVEDISDRKQNEFELKHVKEQLELVIEAASEGFWGIDYRSDEYYYSSQWKAMLGYHDHELDNSEATWHKVICPEELAEVSQFLEDYRTGKINEFLKTIRFIHKDGSIRYIYARAIAVKDSENRVVRIIGSNLDITNLKQTEIALQESKENYRKIVENSQEGIWVIDDENKTIFANSRLEEMLGYSLDELRGNSFLEFMEDEDKPAAIEHLRRRKQGIRENHIAKLRRKDGSMIWVMVSVATNTDAQGHPCGAIGLLTDMTQIVQYQEALELSQMQLKGVLDTSLDGIMAFRSLRDAQGRILDFEWLFSNPSACELVGRPQENFIGKQLLVEMPGNWEEGLFDDYVKVVESGIPYTKQFYYNNEGINAWFEIMAVKLGDGFTVTFRDITELKQSQQQLHNLNQQLAARLQDLEQRNQDMKLLNEISDFLQSCLTVEEACLAIGSFIRPLFPDCSGAIYMLNNSRNQVKAVATWGNELESLKQFYPQDCWALRRGTVHSIGPHNHGLKCNHIDTDCTEISAVCIPMIAQGEPLGLLYINGNQGETISSTSQELVRTVAEQVSMAIANLKLRETLQQQSIRDPLTGLFNRRYLDEFFDQEIQRAQRNHHAIGVMMLDIDHFKQFNDTYGHDAGDFVLQQVGQLLSRNVRGSDIACRYGGEEMTLLLPESSFEATTRRAEQICQSIRDLRLTYQGQPLLPVTASLGVASFPEQGLTRGALLRAADKALYRAKAGGRNQVVVG